MAEIRCFVAVELDRTAGEALADLQKDLKQKIPVRTVRWVKSETIHLTLQFLGDAPTNQVETLVQALRTACAGLPAFQMSLEGLGVFPNPKRPRIVWVGVSEPSGALQTLQLRVGQALAPLGFTPEDRPFSPHLTIARMAHEPTSRDMGRLGDLVSETKVGRLAVVQVDHVTLMKSDLRPQGSVYTPLAVLPLGR